MDIESVSRYMYNETPGLSVQIAGCTKSQLLVQSMRCFFFFCLFFFVCFFFRGFRIIYYFVKDKGAGQLCGRKAWGSGGGGGGGWSW